MAVLDSDTRSRLLIQKEELHHNVTAGVVLSDHSLVLQSITRESAGGYTCMATNVEGRAKSNVVNLEVMFAPVCKYVLNKGGGWRHQNATPPPFNVPEEVHGALKHETISLVCEVEASPTNVTFHWTFNNSGDLSDVPSTNYSNEGTTSRLNYTPVTDTDYGALGCWASNSVGHSKQPCLYQIIAAGRPYPLQNCTTYNMNGSWVRISCVEGYDGGLPQKFVAIVGKRRLESSLPFWEFQMLKPAKVALYAVNAKGSSEPYAIEVVLKGVAKFTGESTSSTDMSPILIGLGGTATGLGLIVTGVLMALWRRHAATPAKPKPPQQPSIATFAGKGDEEDGNPDLIPTTALTNHLTVLWRFLASSRNMRSTVLYLRYSQFSFASSELSASANKTVRNDRENAVHGERRERRKVATERSSKYFAKSAGLLQTDYTIDAKSASWDFFQTESFLVTGPCHEDHVSWKDARCPTTHSTVSKGRTRNRSAGAFRRAAFKGQTPVGTLREVGRRQSRRMDEKIQTSAASSNFWVVDHRSTGYRRPLDHG
ncbi:hypothetical protein G5I_04641 [Acromyrmex echinatior]|uniref:Ig-like domain-containing protein n=1 Tax=Acromyrmex echinatior TaxID=103372 RepID=F4WG68_ACREC|nr:hypothetical protein G5I_04641 [Acromyrmex echinatior]